MANMCDSVGHHPQEFSFSSEGSSYHLAETCLISPGGKTFSMLPPVTVAEALAITEG